MDECNAALVLMSLSCSPHSPRQGIIWIENKRKSFSYLLSSLHFFSLGCDTALGSSPGSSSASWSTGSSSPPLSDDNLPPTTDYKYEKTGCTNFFSTSDEGIAMDYNEDMPRKRRVSLIFLHNLNIQSKQS
jgi:hypothetical protein